jgi:hypothetical protein
MVDCEPERSPSLRYEFEPCEYRRICDLLQDGVPPELCNDGGGEFLVIELTDGRHIALIRQGVDFSLQAAVKGASSGFCVRAEALARYIEEATDQQPIRGIILRRRSATSPATPGGGTRR